MWFSSIILLIYKLIYVNGDGVWNFNGENLNNLNNYNEVLWSSGAKETGGTQINNINEKYIDNFRNNPKNEDNQLRELNNNKYSDEKFETGVSIGYDEHIEGKELRVNEDKVTNEDNFVRPCPFDDWECIRKFFAHNSDCKPAYGPAPDPLYLKQITLYFALSNMTYTLTDLAVKGLSTSKIVEFYYNKKTGDLVFAVDVKNFNITTPKGYFSYRRTAKESIVLADYATIQLKSIILTAVIPKIPKLRLDLAEIHGDIPDARPDVFIGPKAYTSKDPDVIQAYADFIAFFPFALREGIFFQVPLYMTTFIQQSVCDFGLKLNSV